MTRRAGSKITSSYAAGLPATGCCRCQMLTCVQETGQTLKKNSHGLLNYLAQEAANRQTLGEYAG